MTRIQRTTKSNNCPSVLMVLYLLLMLLVGVTTGFDARSSMHRPISILGGRTTTASSSSSSSLSTVRHFATNNNDQQQSQQTNNNDDDSNGSSKEIVGSTSLRWNRLRDGGRRRTELVGSTKKARVRRQQF